MHQKKMDKDEENYASKILVPPGLNSFSMTEGDQKQTLQEDDNHFLQYVDRCKSKVNEIPQIKHKVQGNKNTIENNRPNSSNDKDNKKQNEQSQEEADNIQYSISKSHQKQYHDDHGLQEIYTIKDSNKKKHNSMHIDPSLQNRKKNLNLVDKFLVGVISPSKVRQSQGKQYDELMNEQEQIDLYKSKNTSQINELLNQQQQIMMQQLNQNHSQVINLSNTPQMQHDYLQNTILNQQQGQNQNHIQDQSIFLNRLLVMRSNQPSTSSHVHRGAKPYFESLKIQNKKENSQEHLVEKKQIIQQNNSFSPNHYTAGSYSFYQKLLPSTRTMENLLGDEFVAGQIEQNGQENTNGRTNLKKLNDWKIEYELKKIQQMKENEDKQQKSITNGSYPEVSLPSQQDLIDSKNNSTNKNGYRSIDKSVHKSIDKYLHKSIDKNVNTFVDNSVHKFNDNSANKFNEISVNKFNEISVNKFNDNSENALNQLSTSNIGFGQPANKVELNVLRLRREDEKQKVHQSNIQSMIYYNNLGQLSVQDNHSGNRRRLVSNLSLSPNNSQTNNNNNESNTQKTNPLSSSLAYKFGIYSNSVFDSFALKDKTPTSNASAQQKDQNLYQNRSFDLKMQLTRKLQAEKAGKLINFESDLLNKNVVNKDNGVAINENRVSLTYSGIFNQKNSLQRNVIAPSHLLYAAQTAQSTKNSNTLHHLQSNYNQTQQHIQELSTSPYNNNHNNRVGSGKLYYQQQNANQQPLISQEHLTSEHLKNTNNNGRVDEDYHIKKKRLYMKSLKRSPQKGNSIKNKDRQNTQNKQDKQFKPTQINKDQIDRISTVCGVSPSLLRKSLQCKEVSQSNVINSSQVLNDVLNSITNQKTIDMFQFYPFDQNASHRRKGNNTNISDYKAQQQTIPFNDQINNKCFTEGNNDNYLSEEDYEQDDGSLTPNYKFQRYEIKQQTEAENQKIKKLFRDTLQKRNQYNQMYLKKPISSLTDEDIDIQTIHTQHNKQYNLENNSFIQKRIIKTPINQLKQFSFESPSISQNKESNNNSSFSYSKIPTEGNQPQDSIQKEKNQIDHSIQQKDKNIRFIHLCVVRNTQDFVQFLQDKKIIFSGQNNQNNNAINNQNNNNNNRRLSSLNKQKSINYSMQICSSPSQTSNNNNNNNNTISFKKQISIDALENSNDNSFYLKVICIPRQKHLIYMTEMSLKYAQDKSFFSNFHQLLQRLNSQENITPHEPFKYIFSNNFTQMTNIFEVQDNIPLLIISKQKVFSSRSTLIEEMSNYQISTTPTSFGNKSRLSQQAGQYSGLSCNTPIIPSPHVAYINKSSILGKADSQPNPSLLLQMTIKNSIRDKMRAQSSLENNKMKLQSPQQTQYVKTTYYVNSDLSPLEQDSTTTSLNRCNRNRFNKQSTPIQPNSIIELFQSEGEVGENKLDRYVNTDTGQYQFNSSSSQKENLRDNTKVQKKQQTSKSNNEQSKLVIHLQPQTLKKQIFDFDQLNQTTQHNELL